MRGLVSLSAAIFGIATALSGSVEAAPNILLIIGDDMGVETLASYGIGENPPRTVTLDQLVREGARFTNFWSQPVCSPTRATVMTGRYGFRTGVGRALTNLPALPDIPEKPDGAPYEPPPMRGSMGGVVEQRRAYLPSDEFTLPMALKTNEDLGYVTAAIGKWHLGDVPNGWLRHPELVGFDCHSGPFDGSLRSYFSWNKVVNQEFVGTTGYAPVDKTTDAIAWIKEQGKGPWFLWLAYNLPHPPLHLPPSETWQSDYSHLDPQADPLENPYPYFNAMIEAMDSQISRLLASLNPEVRANTYVIFMGDNGSVMYPGNSEGTPFREGRGKGTVYEGGVHVPLIITGPSVAQGSVSESLVNSTDLYFTIMQMAGLEPAEIVPAHVTTDSSSFFSALSNPDEPSPREWIYADHFFGTPDGVENADYAIRNERYKLLKFKGVEEFYDLQEDPYEYENLLTRELSVKEQVEYRSLKEQVLALRRSD